MHRSLIKISLFLILMGVSSRLNAMCMTSIVKLSKSQKEAKLRPVLVDDAERFLQFLHQLDRETDTMAFEPGARSPDVAKQRELIQSSIQTKGLLYGAEVEQKFVGFLGARILGPSRLSHSASFITGILPAFQRQGIGQEFLKILDRWAKESKLKRLELSVLTQNNPAIALYQRAGFEIEGTKRGSILKDGKLLDEYIMGKLIQAD